MPGAIHDATTDEPQEQDAPQAGVQDSLEQAQRIINDNTGALDLFAAYMEDGGIAALMMEAWLSMRSTPVADQVIETALDDFNDRDDGDYASCAASLDLLVRVARRLGQRIIPPEALPTAEVIDAALLLFHQEKRDEAL